MDSPDLSPMLASDLRTCTPGAGKLWAVEPKLDGMRVLVTADCFSNSVSYQTRNGNPVLSLSNLASLGAELLELSRRARCPLVLDCEAIAGQDFFDGIGKLRQKKTSAEGFEALAVFDVPWTALVPDLAVASYAERRQLLEDLFELMPDRKLLRLVPQFEIIPTECLDASALLTQATSMGWEGVMLKDVDAPYYSGKRSRAWLKLKEQTTYDCKVVGFQPGKGRYDGAAGALLILSPKGKVVSVGSGLTDDQRLEIYDHPGRWVGQTVEVACQQFTPSGSMRHPVFIKVRADL